MAAHFFVRSPKPIERSDDGSLPAEAHAAERIVSQVRLRYLLDVVSGLYSGEESRFGGDSEAGEFMLHDGSGNSDFLFWNHDGVVGASFEGDSAAPGDIDPETKSPEQCFPRAPDLLRPLVARAIAVSRGELTGGIWVTRGEGALWAEEGSFTEAFPGYYMTPDAALGDGAMLQSWAELSSLGAAHVAVVKALHARSESGPCTVTEEEAAVLGASPEGDAVEKDTLAGAVKRLARVGVIWDTVA